MKKIILATAMNLIAGLALADPVEGLWKTQEDDGAYAYVAIKPCGPSFCGFINRTFKEGTEYESENIGKKLVIDMTPQGDGKYEGKVWRPSNNKIYHGTIALTGDKIKLAGCVAGGLICSKQEWRRQK